MDTLKSKSTVNKSGGYTKTIIGLLIFCIMIIPRVLKSMTKMQLFIYWLGMFLIGIIWTLIVNNIYVDPAWVFSKESYSGWSFCNIIFEDYLFYVCSPVVFLVVFILLPRISKFPVWLAFTILPVSILFSVESFVGLAILICFSLPMLILAVQNNWKINWYSFLLLIPSTAWDYLSTNYLYHWTYPKYIYKFWLLNSPLVITPWFSIIGILLAYQWYLFVRIKL